MNGIRVFLCALAVSLAAAESPICVRGSIEGDKTLITGSLTVELEATDPLRQRFETRVGGDGGFEFQNIAAGRYTLRLTDARGGLVREQFVDVNQHSPLIVRLSDQKVERPVSGTVSVARLKNPVPKKAFQLFVEAQRESGRGRHAEAAGKLEAALRIYPEYFEARSNLGSQYMRLGRTTDALREFEQAAAIEPSALILSNLSLVYMHAGRVEEAQNTTARAIDLDPAAYIAHYLLGLALTKTPERIDEAEKHLRLATRAAPQAHVALAKLYFSLSKHAAGERELQAYMKSGDTRFRTQIEGWLADRTRSRGLPASAE